MSEAFEKGIKIFGEVYGEDMARGVRGYSEANDQFGNLQSKWAMEWAFGTVWSREELPRKLRSCAVLGMTIGLGTADEIKMHVKMGIANGLRPSFAEGLDAGWPAIPFFAWEPLAEAVA